ncbi:MAG: hypothetical protein AABO41_25775 [Acidobacteriota bacterium]
MAGSGNSSDNIKKIAAAVLGGAMVIVLVYQFLFSGPTPKPTLGTRNANTSPAPKPAPSQSPSAAAPQKALSASAVQDALVQAMLADTTPLNLAVLSHAIGGSKPGERGNIFGFFVEPPKPAPPPPPPPPIVLTGLSPQSAIASAPQKVTVTVVGSKIPPDAQVYYEGLAKPTKRINETQLSIELEPGEYSVARSYNVEVKSPADPAHMNSNVIQFVAQAPPEPGVVFKARLGDLAQPQSSFAVFEVQGTREIKRFRKGEMLQGVWRIDAINADSVDLTHTQYDIKRRIPLQEKPK